MNTLYPVLFISQSKIQKLIFYLFHCLQEKIRSNYDAMRFRPEHFVDYLLSDSVGFATFEVLEIPQHKASGKNHLK